MTAAQDNQYAKVASFGVAYSANFLLFTAIAPIPCWHEMLNKYGTGCLKEEGTPPQKVFKRNSGLHLESNW